MKKDEMKRRRFLQTAAAGTAVVAMAAPTVLAAEKVGEDGQLALLGGQPVRSGGFPSWPMIEKNDEAAWADVLQKKGWCRLDGDYVNQFEKEYAKLTGVKECLATSNGTNALFGAMSGLDIGPGDEVLVPPYTFVATINVPFLKYALPVFVDTDPETFQMDPNKIEEKITERTRCICPVHIGGYVANMDAILAIAKKHNLSVVEDACQAHLAEWKGKKVGSWGDAGCFSFQVTKNLSGGEGGAIISNNSDLIDRCYSFHSNGRERTNKYGYQYIHNGTNMRMTEFQGALLLQQMTRIEAQAKVRTQNAEFLTEQLKQIPGITPAKHYDGVTRTAYHLYMFRYDPSQFAGAPRDKFLKALNAEGVSSGGGYGPLNKEPLIEETLRSRGFQAVYSKERIDKYLKENNCPANDKLCQEAVWFFQSMLLGSKSDMEQIVAAIRKIHNNAAALAKA
ncbi:MAG: DegT/DnrJ/EryC1/StrS family aminotransferase [bacterium]